MPDLILSIISTGTPEHPRYQIADPHSKFWTGDGWSASEADARLYATVNDAGHAIQEILLAEHGDKPVRRFVAPLCVDLYSDTDLTMREIGNWLSKVARLTINAEKHGNGPVTDTLGLTWIDWSQLREIEDKQD